MTAMHCTSSSGCRSSPFWVCCSAHSDLTISEHGAAAIQEHNGAEILAAAIDLCLEELATVALLVLINISAVSGQCPRLILAIHI